MLGVSPGFLRLVLLASFSLEKGSGTASRNLSWHSAWITGGS